MSRTASLPIFLERGDRTLQDQIYDSIRHCIVAGLIGADRRLPSTRVLAADLGVSRTTALLALEQLRAEGYIVARRGSGTFTAPRLPESRAPDVAPAVTAMPRPAFSRRGALLAHLRAPDRRRSGSPACAFRLGTPALDVFPHRTWTQIAREMLRATKPAHRDYAAVPPPTFSGEQTMRSAPTHSSANTAPTMSMIESSAPTSCRWTFSTGI